MSFDAPRIAEHLRVEGDFRDDHIVSCGDLENTISDITELTAATACVNRQFL